MDSFLKFVKIKRIFCAKLSLFPSFSPYSLSFPLPWDICLFGLILISSAECLPLGDEMQVSFLCLCFLLLQIEKQSFFFFFFLSDLNYMIYLIIFWSFQTLIILKSNQGLLCFYSAIKFCFIHCFKNITHIL